MKKVLLGLSLAAFLTVIAAPAVLADDKDQAQMVPKACRTSWGAIKSMWKKGSPPPQLCRL